MSKDSKTSVPLRLLVPHDETDEHKVASFPNPDHACVDEAFERAKAEAETLMRKAYVTLREHFEPLPVLRWVDDAGAYPGETVAFGVNGWSLGAAYGNWWLEHKATGAQVLSPRPNAADAATNRRAAEAALRSLGVAFRVEGGAK